MSHRWLAIAGSLLLLLTVTGLVLFIAWFVGSGSVR